MANLSNYINVETVGSTTILHISVTGAFTGGVYSSTVANQHIALDNVTLTGATNADKLNQLLANGQLIIG